MDLLLDTHTFIWFLNGDHQVPKKIIDLISDNRNRCYLSIASIWEIAIKTSLGRLEINAEFTEIKRLIAENDIDIVPINFEHLTALQTLTFFHRDPFDRLIISQAKVENLIILTKDKEFVNYPISVIWD